MTLCLVCGRLSSCPIVREIVSQLGDKFDGVMHCGMFEPEQDSKVSAEFAEKMIQAAIKAKLCETGRIMRKDGMVHVTTNPQVTGEQLLVALFKNESGGRSCRRSAEQS